jgi:hypothetical protein
MMTKIDQKKLIDAGAVDQVKADITKSFQQQLDEANQRARRWKAALRRDDRRPLRWFEVHFREDGDPG